MKVTVVRGGGLAGGVVEVSVDTADLDDTAAAELRARARAVGVPDLTDRPRRARPDGVRVELALTDDEGAASAVRFDEHDAPDGARDLVRWVLDCPRGVRHR